MMNNTNTGSLVTIALPSGRLFKPIMHMMAKSDYFGTIHYDEKNDRRLIFYNENNTIRFIITKPTDNPTYVECGVADIGIVGKDILMEKKNDVYELLDLGLGQCKIVLAATRENETKLNQLENRQSRKIATKYPYISRIYCREKGINAEIIKLYGSIELAPQVGLADMIIDLVSTGKTLRHNNLEVIDEIIPVSARLITNRISYKTKHRVIHQITNELKKICVINQVKT